MAIEKQLLGRIIHKHDIEENWDKATGFIPKQGEIIVYDIDENYNYERFKIGDGNTSIINLPFQKTNVNDLKAVSYDMAQELTDDQKTQARTNIGAISIDDIPTPDVQPSAIIDVTSLPTENIETGSWYRLLTGTFVYNQEEQSSFTARCVNELPEIGDPVTTDMSDVLAYYSISDNDVYGYINDMLAASAGVPAGWYTLTMLAPIFDVSWSGIITNIDDDPCDASFRLLLKYDFYMYQDGWCKVPFAYEEVPKINITWDGDMTGRTVFDMSTLGYDEGVYFVKVSDDVFTTDEVIGCKVEAMFNNGSFGTFVINQDNIDTTAYSGAFVINNYITIIYSQDEFASALNIPTGIYTNGVYFYLKVNYLYITKFVSPFKITKIDRKYLDCAGKNVAGQEFVVDGTSMVAKEGAEIFNDYANNIATGLHSHTEGSHSHSEGSSSHAEGFGSHAKGHSSHAEGGYSHAEGGYSHAEGYGSHAKGEYSHAEGRYTHAKGENQHVQGTYNIIDNSNQYAHIVGNGTNSDKRSNAHTLDWQGNAWFAGDVYVGSTSGTNKDEGSVKLVKNGDTELILTSSTAGSTKKFIITIDDNGVLTTEEVSK